MKILIAVAIMALLAVFVFAAPAPNHGSGISDGHASAKAHEQANGNAAFDRLLASGSACTDDSECVSGRCYLNECE